MEFRQLRHFLSIYELGSFARASEACHISQPAISGSIGQLEARLGVKLFERGSFGARPTPYANRLYPSAKLIFAEVDRSSRDLVSMKKGEAGSVSIGVGPLFEHILTPRILEQFVKDYPLVPVSIFGGITSELYVQLSRGELDFTISTPPEWVLPPDNLDVEVLDESRDVIVAAPHHPLWESGDFSLKSLAQYPWVITAQVKEAEQNFFKAFAGAEVELPKTVVRSDSISILTELIRARNFLSIVSNQFAHTKDRKGRFLMKIVPADYFNLPRHICFATRKNAILSPAAEVLSDAFRKRIREAIAEAQLD